MKLSSRIYVLFFAPLLFVVLAQTSAAQDWFRAGTGLGDTSKPRVAVADFGPRADNAKPHATLFVQVVRDDLQFSGILDLVSPSMYPTSVPTQPSELRNLDWTNQPANANMVATALMPKDITGNPLIYPPAAVRARFYTITAGIAEQVRERTRLWTTIKTGR